jgi:hypothetical protein
MVGWAGRNKKREVKNMKDLKVKLTFIEEVLGTSSNNPNIHSEFIASKAPDAMSREEEIAAIGAENVEEKSITIFPKLEDGTPFAWDYQIKGFFKDACGMLRNVPGTESAKIKAYKKYIDGLVFLEERKIPFTNYGKIGECQRPLRGQTAQGERIALAHSETVEAGSELTFTIWILKEDMEKVIREWLDYGKLRGMFQWRNSGKGRFTWEELSEDN